MSTTIEIPPGESIDRYLRDFRDPGTTFVLGAGEYTTAGCFDFPEHDLCMLAPECQMVGAGSGKTFLVGYGIETKHEGKPTGYAEILTGGARTRNYSESIYVRGLSVFADSGMPCVGLHLWSSRAYVDDVRAEDLHGYRDHAGPVKEAFGILINNSAGKPSADGGHLVRNCAVYLDPADSENYTTAIFIGCVKRTGSPLLRSAGIGCLAVADGDGHAAFAMNDRTTFIDCESVGFRRAVFVDTGPIRDSHILRMDATECGWALDLRGSGERRGITLQDSSFAFRDIDGWAQGLLVSDDDSGAPACGIHVEGCRFLAPGTGRASVARLRGKNVEDFTEFRNLWAGKWEPSTIQNRE